LEVSYFSIAAFDPNSLGELKKVKDQIVKLNLNKMPLAGVDLSVLKEMNPFRRNSGKFHRFGLQTNPAAIGTG